MVLLYAVADFCQLDRTYIIRIPQPHKRVNVTILPDDE